MTQFILALFEVLPALVVGGLLGAGVVHLYGEYIEFIKAREARKSSE